MEQNKVNESKGTIRLVDLLGLFVKKFKAIVIVSLIVAIIAGSLGAVLDVMDSECVAEVNVQVSPVDESDRLLMNLRSGRFAEQLLLEENGLPPKSECNAEDYEKALDAIKAFEDAREKRWNKHVENATFHMTEIENTYKRLEAEYDEALALLQMYKAADGEGYVNNEDHLKMVKQCEDRLLAAESAKKEYYVEHYLPADNHRVSLQAELIALKDELDIARREMDEAVEKVLSEWRKLPEVESKIRAVTNVASYNYFESVVSKNESDAKDDKNQSSVNKGYIKVQINIPAKDEEFANELAEAYEVKICDYIEKQVEYTSGRADVDCILIDPVIFVENSLSPIGIAVSAAKIAAVAAIIAAVIVYLFFVCKMLFESAYNHPADEEK